MDDLEAVFPHSIPSLFRQVEENLHSDNLNVKEYFERRLDDHAYVIRSIILQCEQQSASEGLIQLLDLVHEEVNGLTEWSIQGFVRYTKKVGFSCPVEQSTGRGRPRFYIPEEVIRGLRDVHGVWKEVAKESTCILQKNSTKVTSVLHGS